MPESAPYKEYRHSKVDSLGAYTYEFTVDIGRNQGAEAGKREHREGQALKEAWVRGEEIFLCILYEDPGTCIRDLLASLGILDFIMQ